MKIYATPSLPVAVPHRRILAIIGLALFLAGNACICEAGAAPPFQHIIIVVQENRTPDTLFHGLDRVLPGADIADYGYNSKGQKIKLKPWPLQSAYDPRHQHPDFMAQYDNGKMDGNDKVVCYPILGPCPPNFGFKYVRWIDVAPYFYMARHWGFANRMFQTQQGPSYPGHQMLFGATSQPSDASPYFVSSNMEKGQTYAGCAAPSNQRVLLIGPNGLENMEMYPCYEHVTLSDMLDAAHLSWRYYANSLDGIWTAPNSIDHICDPSPLSTKPGTCTGTEFKANVIADPAQVLRDIANGDLASVSWVTPDGDNSDHPASKVAHGPSWVAAIVNTVGRSKYWNNTAILVTWDEWGGWYDHVPPPMIPGLSYYELGFRVPLLVISPYTPWGHVSNVQHDFGSILHFVEATFGLGFIPPGTFADSRADDLADFFTRKTPRPFEYDVPAPLPASYFLNNPKSVTGLIDVD